MKTIEQLLKEAEELLQVWLSDNTLENKDKKIVKWCFDLEEFIKAKPKKSIELWGEALDQGAQYVGYSDFEDIIQNVGMHSLKAARKSQVFVAIEKAANIYAAYVNKHTLPRPKQVKSTQDCNFNITRSYKKLPDETIVDLRIKTDEKLQEPFFEELMILVNKHINKTL